MYKGSALNHEYEMHNVIAGYNPVEMNEEF